MTGQAEKRSHIAVFTRSQREASFAVRATRNLLRQKGRVSRLVQKTRDQVDALWKPLASGGESWNPGSVRWAGVATPSLCANLLDEPRQGKGRRPF